MSRLSDRLFPNPELEGTTATGEKMDDRGEELPGKFMGSESGGIREGRGEIG